MLSTTHERSINVAVQAAVLTAGKVVQQRRRQQQRGRRRGSSLGRMAAQRRQRTQVKDIYQQLGPVYFKRSYRMKYESFKKLARKLHHGIMRFSGTNRFSKNYIHNGRITPSVRLACALRYFAGGSPYDIMTTYCLGHTDTINSIWYVVEAINSHPEFQISYPARHEEQRAIAEGFRKVSDANFDCCAGAIDGILIWIHKPTEDDCNKAGCSSGKFFCGRKHKFGLNCQAVCNVRGKFLDLSIVYPGSTSDCLAFEGMSLFRKLEGGLLAPGLCFFGDNAYLNSIFMATPFSAVSGGSKDAYNFYQSQLRIRIECAFGMLTHRWAILRSAIPMNISLKRTIALVIALAKLHNFCIDEKDLKVPAVPPIDELRTEMQGGVPLETTTMTGRNPIPRQLIGGGNHFDDMDRASRRRRVRQYEHEAQASHQQLPRDRLHDLIAEANLRRPVPTTRTTRI